MTLKTSSRKINPFWNMIWFATRKNLGIIIVLCIASLLYYPGSFIVNYENLLASAVNNQNNYLLENFGIAITIFSTIVAIFFNMINFGFLYKKNSSDVFHAFPLTRCELLLSRFLSGLFSTLIPTLLCYTSFGVLLAFNSWMGNFAQLFYYLLYNVIIILVCSSFSMIFVISAGSAFDLGVSLIGGNLALLAVGAIFDEILGETLMGYSGYDTSDILYNLSPPYFCGVGLSSINKIIESGFLNGVNIEFLIRSIIYIAIFIVASLLLYNHRKAEKGGTAYAYKFMYLGCSLLAGICGGYMLGMIFAGDFTLWGFWLFATIGSLLTTVIYGTITDRGFKGVKKSLIMGAVSSIVLIAVAVSGITGCFGYASRIPKVDKVQSVSIDVFDESITFDNPQMAIELHQAILDRNATEFNDEGYKDGTIMSGFVPSFYRQERVKIYYKLKNGKTMSRSYRIFAPKVSDKLLAIYKSDERLDMINEEINTVDAQEIKLYFEYEGGYHTANITKTETKEFLDAYWQDVLQSDESIFSQPDYNYLELSGYRQLDHHREIYFNFMLEDHNNFVYTKQFIEEKNLVERAQNQEEFNEKY